MHLLILSLNFAYGELGVLYLPVRGLNSSFFFLKMIHQAVEFVTTF